MTIHLNSTLIELNQGRPNKTIHKLGEEGIKTVEDLLWVMPLHWEIVPEVSPFDKVRIEGLFRGEGRIAKVKSQRSRYRGKGRAILYRVEVSVRDRHGPLRIDLIWPNAYPSLKEKIEGMDRISFFGKIRKWKGRAVLMGPTIVEEGGKVPRLQIQYPTLGGVRSFRFKSLVDKIPESLWKSLEDPLSKEQLQSLSLPHLRESFELIHGHLSHEVFLGEEDFKRARKRLIYHEFYLEQIQVDIRRQARRDKTSIRIEVSFETVEKIFGQFPFELREGQKKAVWDIVRDFKAPFPMRRMIQADVGHGKTVVAFIGAMIVGLGGHQAALMCPTETLARQHYRNARPLFEKQNLRCVLLLGGGSRKNLDILEKISSGQIDFVIGTHSLFQERVRFKSLALSIIDEQHKFGVTQRASLAEKGHGTHVLIMTATPIPRSLACTGYGELDLSIIKDASFVRKGTQTRIVTPASFETFLGFLKTRMDMGEQIYVVSPVIEDGGDHGLSAVKKVFERFRDFFPHISIELLHGKLDSREKNLVFESFLKGDIQMLISTTVIEVGIHVVNATVMAVINSERFGLSSLHQLRGRVGRGDKAGFCFLVTESDDPHSLRRLKVVEQISDGFEIAEADLSFRGEGDLFGHFQSGQSPRKVADMTRDQDIFWQVKKDFQLLRSSDVYRDNYRKFSRELSAVENI
ncbi:MAG: ATP-dependent DNA helicase RecG [Bacteriovoracales bacterium]|nr:ATP-dependent DNA helicase RecG [Bacteriovoracales bacterium]